MKRKKTENFSETWFFKWVLNNQAVVAFLILLFVISQPFNVSRHRFPRNMNQMRMYLPLISTPVGNLDIS